MRRMIAFCWLWIGLCLLPGLAPPAAPVPLLPICVVQGSGLTSPYQGFTVRTRGVVFADFDQTAQKGFYIQDPDCDASPATSDGLLIYLAERSEVVQQGDRVEVTGLVQEDYGLTELQAVPQAVAILSRGNPLPAASELNPPADNLAARQYFETLESMYVRLSEGRVVGPTDADDRTWLVQAASGLERVFYDHPSGSGQIICADDGGLFEISPEVRTGSTVLGLSGTLDFSLGTFCLELTVPPQILPAAPPDDFPAPQGVRLATWNLDGLFDAADDPLVDDTLLSNTEYQRRLQKRALAIHQALGEPALLAVQEVENLAVLQALVARLEIAAPYGVVWVEGADLRGIDVALLYRTDQVEILSYESRQGCTSLADGFEPDGNGDPVNPQSWPTCDTDGDGQLDGNRLFSRPPLIVQVRILAPPATGLEVWLVINHWKSRVEDTREIAYTLPRRIEQARFVANLGRELRTAHPGKEVVLLGDLNDLPGSAPLQELAAAGFANLLPGSRYSYIYQGISQPLDYILVAPSQQAVWMAPGAAHIGADFPTAEMSDAASLYRSSDHDPVWVELAQARANLYLPVVLK